MKRLKFHYLYLAVLVFIVPSARALTVDLGLEFDSAVPVEIKNQMLTDFETVKSFRGSETSMYYQEIFKSAHLEGPSLLKFFNDRVRRVEMDDCGGGPSIGACVIPLKDPTVMYLTNNFVTFDIPQIFRISVLFHESRHTEVNEKNWLHADCPVPFLGDDGKDVVGIISGVKMEGLAACDYSAFGSYGMQAVLLKNLELHCDNCSEKMRMDAKLFGDDTLKRIVDTEIRQSLQDDLQ